VCTESERETDQYKAEKREGGREKGVEGGREREQHL